MSSADVALVHVVSNHWVSLMKNSLALLGLLSLLGLLALTPLPPAHYLGLLGVLGLLGLLSLRTPARTTGGPV